MCLSRVTGRQTRLCYPIYPRHSTKSLPPRSQHISHCVKEDHEPLWDEREWQAHLFKQRNNSVSVLTGATAKLQVLKEKLHNVKKMITKYRWKWREAEWKEVHTLFVFSFMDCVHGLSLFSLDNRKKVLHNFETNGSTGGYCFISRLLAELRKDIFLRRKPREQKIRKTYTDMR